VTTLSHKAQGISPPFEAYSGEGPYSFISYAHADKVLVFNSMRKLHESGANIWYDEGIKAAGEWVEEIASAIKNSSLFIVFISPRAVESRYVKSEVGYAISENKEILTIFVEETTLPAGLSLCLQQFQSVSLDDPSWQEKALKAIFQRMETPATPSLEEVDTEEDFIDHGKILWDMWEHSRSAQKDRFKRSQTQSSSIEITQLEISSLVQGEDEGVETDQKDSSRHPVTVKVGVVSSEESTHTPGDEFHDPTAGTMMWIPPGEISIKVPYSDETKVVHVKKGYWMAKYLVTQRLFEYVMGQNPSFFDSSIRGNLANLPVNNVSWLDAVSFCKALTILSKNAGDLPQKYEYRLPTEVEWEYACRAGTVSDYYFGNDISDLQEHAWYRGNSIKKIHPVGLKSPNPWGLYDMYGNVREWVGNSFVNTLLNDSEQDEFRISRGGAYMKTAAECQSSSRSTNSLNHRFRNLGFRPVLAAARA
jgi:formylglycine-generating enzyme required for sulfatase activity